MGLAVAVALVARPPDLGGQDVERGKALYVRWCAECHGESGRGDGPAADHMLPEPRDFVQARYQIRTTENGELPTTEDLMRVLRDGMPGTAMPDWRSLTGEERADVVAYIKSFSHFFDGPEPVPMELGGDPGGGAEAVASGREVYERLECFKCHGEKGRGNGVSTPTLEDWRKFPIRAANLTEPWTFNGGGDVEAIHARILTGLDGTPMPAFSDALAAGIVTENELWNLAHYVASLAPHPLPDITDVIPAARRQAMPGPEEDAWADVPAEYIPLVGQVIRKPRQFSPSLDGVWVQAVHDGSVLAVRLAWDDPSRSPDPDWTDWQAKVAGALFSDEPADGTSPLEDGVAIQFPAGRLEGGQLPYFLMGDEGTPVYLWTWTSRSGASEMAARGLGRTEPLDGEGALGATSSYADGRWTVTMWRALGEERPGAPAFDVGEAIPIAFFAWDGSSAETAERGSVSGWYSIVLEAPRAPLVAYGVPLFAALFTLVGGLGAVAAARRRHDGAPARALQPEST